MEKGIGYNSSNVRVVYPYEGTDAISCPSCQASFIVENFIEDPVGTTITLTFKYYNDLEYFWEMIRSNRNFKILPAELYNENGKRIQCWYNISAPSSPIAFSQLSEDVILVYRISVEEIVSSMSYKSILFNEGFNDRFNLRSNALYQRRVAELKLLRTLQDILEAKITAEDEPSDESDTTDIDIDDLLACYERYKQTLE